MPHGWGGSPQCRGTPEVPRAEERMRSRYSSRTDWGRQGGHGREQPFAWLLQSSSSSTLKYLSWLLVSSPPFCSFYPEGRERSRETATLMLRQREKLVCDIKAMGTLGQSGHCHWRAHGREGGKLQRQTARHRLQL